MTAPLTDDFAWKLIEQARDAGSPKQRLAALRASLATKSARELAELDAVVWGWFLALDRESLWVAVVALRGFCSDDGFAYFREWLILEGRDRMHRAAMDPDAMASWDVSEIEGLCSLGERLLRERGEEIEPLSFSPDVSRWPREPRTGNRREPLTELECALRAPRCFARGHDAPAFLLECFRRGDYDSAERVTSALLAADVASPAVFLFLRGVAACEQSRLPGATPRWADAIRAFREALAIEPHSPALWFALAKATAEDGDVRAPHVPEGNDDDAIFSFFEARNTEHIDFYRRALEERAAGHEGAVDEIAKRLDGTFRIDWAIAEIWTDEDAP